MTDFGRRVPLHAPAHQDGGGDQISVAALSGLLADAQVSGPHALAGAAHIADVLADLNALISDATLDKDTDTRTPAAHKASHQNGGTDEPTVAGLSGELADAQPLKAHDLSGARHNAATLATFNTLISDATLDKDTDTRTPAAHKASHQDGGTDEIAATGLVGRVNYVDRGNPSAFDFLQSDLTTDNTYRDLNLSGIIPIGTVAVLIRTEIIDDLTNVYITYRTKGNDQEVNASTVWNSVSNLQAHADFIIKPDANRIIEYKAANVAFTSIKILIGGWFI